MSRTHTHACSVAVLRVYLIAAAYIYGWTPLDIRHPSNNGIIAIIPLSPLADLRWNPESTARRSPPFRAHRSALSTHAYRRSVSLLGRYKRSPTPWITRRVLDVSYRYPTPNITKIGAYDEEITSVICLLDLNNDLKSIAVPSTT